MRFRQVSDLYLNAKETQHLLKLFFFLFVQNNHPVTMDPFAKKLLKNKEPYRYHHDCRPIDSTLVPDIKNFAKRLLNSDLIF